MQKLGIRIYTGSSTWTDRYSRSPSQPICFAVSSARVSVAFFTLPCCLSDANRSMIKYEQAHGDKASKLSRAVEFVPLQWWARNASSAAICILAKLVCYLGRGQTSISMADAYASSAVQHTMLNKGDLPTWEVWLSVHLECQYSKDVIMWLTDFWREVHQVHLQLVSQGGKSNSENVNSSVAFHCQCS